jgi:ATP-dependent protease ClpP protease subunit
MILSKIAAFLVLLMPIQAQALHLINIPANINIKTLKVATLYGVVDSEMEASYAAQTLATAGIPGDRVILINSPGGYETSGAHIIQMMEIEKHQGVRMVCVAIEDATSMAFDILTHCDVRLATSSAEFTVHKIALGGFPSNMRMTAKHLREALASIEADDVKYDGPNARAMHLSRAEYDKFADNETRWSATDLLDRGYLNGIVKLK